MRSSRARGAEDFLRLSKALKQAGQTQLRKELHTGLRDAVKPLIPKTRERALQELPKSGGLAKRVAKAPQRVKVGTGRDPGVTLVVSKNGSGARSTNQGTVRHPVFGRDVYVEQDVPDGWFDNTTKAHRKDIETSVVGALDRVAEQIVRGVRGA